MKPRILFILHLHDAMEEITNRSMRNSKTIAQNRPLLLTGTGCSALMREKRSHGTGKLQKKNCEHGHVSNSPSVWLVFIGFQSSCFSHTLDEVKQKLLISVHW